VASKADRACRSALSRPWPARRGPRDATNLRPMAARVFALVDFGHGAAEIGHMEMDAGTARRLGGVPGSMGKTSGSGTVILPIAIFDWTELSRSRIP
jgi:hypothetical protein